MREQSSSGRGSWGTAFATLLRERGHDVTLAARDPEQVAAIRATGRNPRYAQRADLSGIAAATIEEAPVADAELVVVAVPSRVFGEVVAALPGNAPLLSLTKGLDPETGERLSTLVRDRPVAVLSGPNIAEEIVRGLPAAAVVASVDLELAVLLQVAVNSIIFRVYVNEDIAGVELCAAAKNVIALAAGGADGLGLGDNAKAALVSRGLAEMRRLAEAAGARPDTFAGLAGMGDLIVTCWSPVGAQPPRGRAHRAGRDPGGGARGDRHGRRGPHDRAGAARPLPPARHRAPDHGGRLRRPRGHAAHRPRHAADAPRADDRVGEREAAWAASLSEHRNRWRGR